ncbi:MAG: hypothetical protein AB1805_07825 [Nitrospirota bacterium]
MARPKTVSDRARAKIAARPVKREHKDIHPSDVTGELPSPLPRKKAPRKAPCPPDTPGGRKPPTI